MANENIFYRTLTSADEKQARMVAYSYHREDPICRDLKILVPDEVDSNIDSYLFPALASGLSIGAFDKSCNDKLVGVQFCIPDYRDVSGATKQLTYDVNDPIQWKFAQDEIITTMLHEDTYSGSIFDYLNTDSFIVLYDLTVIPEYQRMGIASRLAKEAIADASKKNFSHMTVEASSRFSRRVYDKVGFENRNCFTYSEYKKRGFSFLSEDTIKEHVGLSLHVLALQK